MQFIRIGLAGLTGTLIVGLTSCTLPPDSALRIYNYTPAVVEMTVDGLAPTESLAPELLSGECQGASFAGAQGMVTFAARVGDNTPTPEELTLDPTRTANVLICPAGIGYLSVCNNTGEPFTLTVRLPNGNTMDFTFDPSADGSYSTISLPVGSYSVLDENGMPVEFDVPFCGTFTLDGIPSDASECIHDPEVCETDPVGGNPFHNFPADLCDDETCEQMVFAVGN